jgi:hypothetical protein
MCHSFLQIKVTKLNNYEDNYEKRITDVRNQVSPAAPDRLLVKAAAIVDPTMEHGYLTKMQRLIVSFTTTGI